MKLCDPKNSETQILGSCSRESMKLKLTRHSKSIWIDLGVDLLFSIIQRLLEVAMDPQVAFLELCQWKGLE